MPRCRYIYCVLSDCHMLSSRQWKGVDHIKGIFKDQPFRRRHLVYWIFSLPLALAEQSESLLLWKLSHCWACWGHISLHIFYSAHLSLLRDAISLSSSAESFSEKCPVLLWTSYSVWRLPGTHKWNNSSFFNSIKTELHWCVFFSLAYIPHLWL